MRALVLLCLLPACGYALATAEKAPNGITKVYVNQAMDAAHDVGPAATLTRVLRDRVATSNALRHVALADAEAVLEARVESAVESVSPQALGGPPTTPKYVLAMTGSARLIDTKGTIVWQSGAITVSEDFASGLPLCNAGPCAPSIVENTIPMTESNRRRALERAAEQLAHELYGRLLEGF
ncbi:MAG: hypothetical protein IT381_13210 [Deltaproteobacteria bacterium]|nr:hypothetical protein [Deltaproteobacteria bacterium]